MDRVGGSNEQVETVPMPVRGERPAGEGGVGPPCQRSRPTHPACGGMTHRTVKPRATYRQVCGEGYIKNQNQKKRKELNGSAKWRMERTASKPPWDP